MPEENAVYDTMRQGAALAVILYPQSAGTGEPSYAAGYEEPLLSVMGWTWRSGGRPNTATLSMSLTDWLEWDDSGPRQLHVEEYEQYVQIDDMVEVCMVFADVDGLVCYLPVFIGFIGSSSVRFEGGQEFVDFLIVGFDQRLDDKIVAGQTAKEPEYDAKVLLETAETCQVEWVGGANKPDDYSGNTVGVDLPLMFNPDGKPNATAAKAEITRSNVFEETENDDGEKEQTNPTAEIYIFEAIGRKNIKARAWSWTLPEAIKYLLFCYNDEKYVLNPDPEDVDKVFEAATEPLNHVDLRGGKKLFSEILPTILAGTKYTFTVCPQAADASIVTAEDGFSGEGKKCQLYFYAKDEGAPAMLHLDVPGTSIIDATWSNVSELMLTRNVLAGSNEIKVWGDLKYKQHCFKYDSNDLVISDFIEAWEEDASRTYLLSYFSDDKFTTDEDLVEQFKKRHFVGGPDYAVWGHAFRSFALDEMGEYDSSYNQGNEWPTYYFYDIFGHDDYMVQNRRFCKTIERVGFQEAKGFYNPVLEISFDSGATWPIVLNNGEDFTVAKNECMITITANDLTSFRPQDEDDLDVNWMQALYDKTLRLKLYACVAEDKRVTATATRQSDAATRFTVQELVIDPLGYQKKDKPSNTEDYIGSLWGHIEMDDSAAAQQTAEMIRTVEQDGTIDGSPVLAGIQLGMEPGMRVEGITGRAISLASSRFSNTRFPQIVAVEFIASAESQLTKLELDVYNG